MPDDLIKEIAEAHASLRRLEDELLALRSQLRPAKKRIAAARAALDALITELASGQSSLPLFRTEAPAGNGLVSPQAAPAGTAPLRGRRGSGCPGPGPSARPGRTAELRLAAVEDPRHRRHAAEALASAWVERSAELSSPAPGTIRPRQTDQGGSPGHRRGGRDAMIEPPPAWSAARVSVRPRPMNRTGSSNQHRRRHRRQ